MTVCVTGATGFIGGHVARLQAEAGEVVRVLYREEGRLERLPGIDFERVKGDVLDRGALRRAARGCELVFHTAGFVGARPPEWVWRMNALSPRLMVEAAAAEGVPRVVLTSSVAGIGPLPRGEVGDEDAPYRGGELGITYVDAKHEGEAEALAAAARLGVEVVVVNPSYVFGVPVDRTQPGETSTVTVGSYLRGRLPAVLDAEVNVVDVCDVAAGHLKAAEHGRPGERYVLGGHDITWLELIERVAEYSGVHHPIVVLPPEVADLFRWAEALRLPSGIAAEGVAMMAQNWRYSSSKAHRELGYRARSVGATLHDTVEWYQELLEKGVLDAGSPSPLSLAAAGLRVADRVGLLGGLRVAEQVLGRRLVTRA